jgi:hypothetical protein
MAEIEDRPVGMIQALTPKLAEFSTNIPCNFPITLPWPKKMSHCMVSQNNQILETLHHKKEII